MPSKPHAEVMGILGWMFPRMRVVQEQAIEVMDADNNTRTLFVDICVPGIMLAIECHGRQHYEFVPHFHASRDDFVRQRENDAAKKVALGEAGYVLVVVDARRPIRRALLVRMIASAMAAAKAQRTKAQTRKPR